MNVTFEYKMSAQDKKTLANIIECKETNLEHEVSKYAIAALKEYITMFLGQSVLRRGSDINEYRLFLLIQEVFKNDIPDEHDVSRLFQTTASESRSLIRSVMSKYQYNLKSAIKASVIAALKSASRRKDDEPYSIIVGSKNLVAEMNSMLHEIDGSLPSVRKKTGGGVSAYVIFESSYNALKKDLKF